MSLLSGALPLASLLSSRFDVEELFFLALSVLSIGVAVAGFIVCVVNLRLSRWLLLAALGFLGEALITVTYEVAGRLMPVITESVDLEVQNYSLIYRGIGFLSFLITGCLILGLALAFSEVKRKFRRLEDRTDYDRDRYGDREADPGRPPRRSAPGSENIQQ